jgi:pseudaminic acid cytidylyltransferase
MRVAVIPARGGSKRIPRKNIKLFHGRPIIAWSINAALRSGLFDRVIVSTDDEEIAQIATRHGAEVPFKRPAELSGDFIGTNAVVRHALSYLSSNGQQAELACCIYATAPFITSKSLSDGFIELTRRGSGFAVSVTSYPFPIQRALRICPDGSISMFQPDNMNTRSQDLEEAWHDAGQFYWGYASAFMEDLPIFSMNSIPIKLSRNFVQDIDTYEDWSYAEMMFTSILNEKNEL